MSLAAAVAAGEEAYDDTAEADNGADDGLENTANAANNSHDGVADSADRGLDTRDDSTHDCSVLEVGYVVVVVVVIVVWCRLGQRERL